MRRWYDELIASGTTIRTFADEFVEADERRVVVVGRVVVDEGGGRQYGSVAGWVYTVVDGCISRVEIHSDPSAALRVAGLAPDGSRAGRQTAEEPTVTKLLQSP
jgi:hypothetical protein